MSLLSRWLNPVSRRSAHPALASASRSVIEGLEPRRLLSTTLYEHSFETAAPDQVAAGLTATWTRTTRTTAPNGQQFLGEFGKENVSLSLADLGAHEKLTISFDLYLARSWDGTSTYGGYGPDKWGFSIDGTPLLDATFSNKFPHYQIPVYQPQSFQSQDSVGGVHDAGTGAWLPPGSLGYAFETRANMDSVYRFTYTVDHTSPTLDLLFRGAPNQGKNDESWGIDNVRIEAEPPVVTIRRADPDEAQNGPDLREGQSDVAAFVVRRSFTSGELSVPIRFPLVLQGMPDIAAPVADFSAMVDGQTADLSSGELIVHFGENDGLEKTIYLSAAPDALIEGPETVTAQVYADSSAGAFTVGEESSASATVEDIPVVSIVASDDEGYEGEADGITFTVSRQEVYNQIHVPLRIVLAPVNEHGVPDEGYATPIVDYSIAGEPDLGANGDDLAVDFAVGEFEKTIVLSPRFDAISEHDESVTISLYDGYGVEGYVFAAEPENSASAMILDLKLDLDIDSDNNNGTGMPDLTAAEDAVEMNEPGKILPVDTGAVPTASTLVPLVIQAPPGYENVPTPAMRLVYHYGGDVRIWKNSAPTGLLDLLPNEAVLPSMNSDGQLIYYVQLTQLGVNEDIALEIEIPGAWNSSGEWVEVDRVRVSGMLAQISADTNRNGFLEWGGADRTTSASPFRFWTNTDSDYWEDGDWWDPLAAETASDRDESSLDFTSDYLSPEIGSGAAGKSDDAKGQVTERDLEDFYQAALRIDKSLWSVFDSVDIQLINPDLLANDSLSLHRSYIPGGEQTKPRANSHVLDQNVIGQIIQQTQNSLFPNHRGRLTISNQAATNLSFQDFGLLFPPVAQDRADEGASGFWHVPFLIEGGTEGQYQLRFTFKDAGGNALDRASLDIKMESVRKKFEVWSVGESNDVDDLQLTYNGNIIPHQASHLSDSGPVSERNLHTNDYVLLVHGWRMQANERRNFADTTFKRLYWQGYQGRFGMFSWPTTFTEGKYWDWAFADNRNNYNRGELRAYHSAEALRNLLHDLKDDGYNTHIVAHSQGNVVTSEALRQEGAAADAGSPPLVKTYVASQAAYSAGAADANAIASPQNVLTVRHPSLAYLTTPGVPDVYSSSPVTGKPYFMPASAAVEKAYNFFNPVDGAVGDVKVWPLNQMMKPMQESSATTSLNYRYNTALARFESYTNSGITGPLNPANPLDLYQIMSFAAESWTTGLGASAGIGGVFTTAGEVNVFSLGANNSREDHSFQFNRTPYSTRLYYNVLLKRLGVTPWQDITPGRGARP